MKLIVKFDLQDKLKLPINYQRWIQAAIYKCLEGDSLFAELHEKGYKNGNLDFKLFTFSYLKGNYKVEKNTIIFEGEVELEIRSIEKQMIERIYNWLNEKGFQLGDYHLLPSEISRVDKKITKEEMTVYMMTPMVAHHTEKEKSCTIFYRPEDKEFMELIVQNFQRKYMAFCHQPEGEFSIELVAASDRDKVVTKYKDFFITGWKGVYKLKGKPEYLDFLYNVGLGSKNAQGFGMFEEKPEKRNREKEQ
ncbi:MAG: CRISPR-associated endoribonuclease Cas6 [Eubacteriales bacterium]|nr:CRISPR-associated endoribonuclease Cas6 [Eubacteriales bacterium]